MTAAKTVTTRLSLPLGVAGSGEPASAPVGTLSFDPNTDTVRVKKSTGWDDVGGGGGGTITSVDVTPATTGLISHSPTGPAVTFEIDFGTTSGKVADGGALATESSTRASADTALSSAISSEASTRASADSTLTTNLASEASTRASADTTLTTNLATHIADTANPHAVTKTQVGLSSVTNDAQLKRAAADFTSFTAKATPVSADTGLLEDSAASDAKKKFTLGTIPVAGDSSGTLAAMQNDVARGLRETAGPTTLAVGAAADLTLLGRNGSTLVGRKPGDFSHKSSPTTADKIMLSDAASSDAIKYSTISEISSAIGIVTGSSSNPYLATPASPHADNDEFTSWSGWTVRDITAGANLTDDGDNTYDPWSFPSSGHYRRKTIGGTTVLLQFPNSNNAIAVYKAITTASNMLIWSRAVGGADYLANAQVDTAQGITFGLFTDSAGVINISTNNMVVELGNLGGAGRKMGFLENNSRTSAGTIMANGLAAPDIFGVRFVSATSWRPFMVHSASGDTFHFSGANRTVTTATRAWVGWRFDHPASNNINVTFQLDFFRRQDGASAWIV